MKTNPAKLNFQNHKVFDEPAPILETELKAADKITVRNPTPSRSMPDPHDLKAGLDPSHQVPGNLEYPREHQSAFRNNFGEKLKYPKNLHLQVPPNPHHLDSGSHSSTTFGEEVRLVESPTHAPIGDPTIAPSFGLWSPPKQPSVPSPSPTRKSPGEGTTGPVESNLFGHGEKTLPYRAPTPPLQRTESFEIGGDSSVGAASRRPAYDDYNQFYE